MTDFDHIRIAVREKPLADDERNRVQVILRTDNDKLIAYYPESKEGLLYNYDYFFPEDATQLDVFQTVGLEMVQRLMHGESSACISYGPSGSGKTHTLFGSDRESGLIQLVCRELFQQMTNDANATKYDVKFSYWEMNNDEIRDALNLDNTANLLVRKNKQQEKLYGGGGIYIPGLSLVDVTAWEELDAYIMKGNVHRIHLSEQRGARWHGFLKLYILSTPRGEGTICTARTLTFVQLKGPDRVGQKGARGEVLKHGCSINKSVSILGSAILHSVELRRAAIKKGQLEGRDPEELYRELPKIASSAFVESKLTQVLTSALNGSEATIFFGNVSALDYHEATDTLENLQNAQQISCSVRRHRYKTNVGILRDELTKLEAQVPPSTLAVGHPLTELEEKITRLREKYQGALEDRELPPTPQEGRTMPVPPIEVDASIQLWKKNTVKAKLHGDRATVYIPTGKKGISKRTYKGQWAHGRRDGFGEYLTDNQRYEGEWTNGMKDGEGTLWVRDKKKGEEEWRRVYTGSWQDDMRHGRGTNWYENGDVYTGYYDHNKRSAIGTLYMKDGSRIEGQWKDDNVEGWATLYQKNNDWFEGHWVAGLREGPGMWCYETKQQCMKGEWYQGICRSGTMEDLPRKTTNEKSAFLPRCGLKDPEGILKAQVKKWEEVRKEKRGQTASGVDWAAEAARSQQETFQGAADDEFDNTDYEIGVGKDKAVGGRGVAFAGQGGAKPQQQGGDEGEEVSW